MIHQGTTEKPNLRPCDAAAYTGISLSHLAKLRMDINQGKGPAYSKVAGCIVYRRTDLDKWLADNLVGQVG